MLKQSLRLKYVTLREDVSQDLLIDSSFRITNHILEIPIWSFQYYHIFMPIEEKKEVDTSYLISILQKKNKKVVVPKVMGNSKLRNCLLSEKTILKKSNWNIPEPVDCTELPPERIDVVFMPLLAFDMFGNRVGYGKGFYDNFLHKCRPDVVKVGLSLFGPEKKITDTHENDVALDYGITPEKIYSFSIS